MILVVSVLVGWFLLSVPVAVVVGRALRRATELPTTVPNAHPSRGGTSVAPPRQRGTGRAA